MLRQARLKDVNMLHKKGSQEYGVPVDWELLESLYFKGLRLNQTERAQLVADHSHYSGLKNELEALWNHVPRHIGFIDNLPQISRALWADLSTEPVPEFIGSYQILSELGRGGMGVVYKAIEPLPLGRTVAVKVLPKSLCSSAWLARFEFEQRTLGSLNHPHIATVYDAGVSQEGQPYLVMELLDGLDIRTFCDSNRLDFRKRLKLIAQICDGVNHAHQKGVLHRDIKPSNILVIEKDGINLPVMIDFGVADLFSDQQNKHRQQPIGTLRYMSPEQVESSSNLIDTRSDIYALGCVLFELLLGVTPLEEELENVGSLRAQCHLIQQCQPRSLASQAYTGVDEAVSKLRNVSPRVYRKALQGELNWVVMKSLARNPNHRYDSCMEFKRDLERYLQNQPVLAGEGHRGYRMRKWFANHWVSVSGGVAILGFILAALFSTVHALRKVRASQKQLQSVHAFSESMFAGIGPYRQGRHVKAMELLDRAVDDIGYRYTQQPDLERAIRLVVARNYRDLGLNAKAEKQFALVDGLSTNMKLPLSESLTIKGERAYNLFLANRHEQALEMYVKAQQGSVEQLGWDHPLTWRLSHGYAVVLGNGNQQSEALALLDQVLERQTDQLPRDHPETLATMNNQGDLFLALQRFGEAESVLRMAVNRYGDLETRRDPFAASLRHNLALALAGQGDIVESIAMNRQVLRVREDLLGNHHPHTIETANNLATGIGNAGDPAKAIALIGQSVENFPMEGMQSPAYLRIRHTLGHFLVINKAFERAEPILEETWKNRAVVLGEDHPDTLKTHITLGELYCEMGQRAKGIGIIEDVLSLAEGSLGKNHPTYRIFLAVQQWAENRE